MERVVINFLFISLRDVKRGNIITNIVIAIESNNGTMFFIKEFRI